MFNKWTIEEDKKLIDVVSHEKQRRPLRDGSPRKTLNIFGWQSVSVGMDQSGYRSAGACQSRYKRALVRLESSGAKKTISAEVTSKPVVLPGLYRIEDIERLTMRLTTESILIKCVCYTDKGTPLYEVTC